MNSSSGKAIAIIGTGIAGLGCAHFLHRQAALTLYEKNDYPGGHTNTISIAEDQRRVPIDTGFMVFNEVTYPNLTRLFRELGVAVKPTKMSFSVQHLSTNLEFCGTSLNHIFAQRRNLVRPRFWKMVGQINRFNTEAVQALTAKEFADMTVGDYVRHRNYGDDFLNFYLVPMSSAVWSTPPELMLEFPAVALLRFFHNHGFLGLHTQHPWFTVVNGAKSYVDKITAPFRDKIRLKRGAVSVRREGGRVKVTDVAGQTETYDQAIFASHADEALKMLGDADERERALLNEFKYQPNTALLHTDASVMPKTKLCWASWNYRIDRGTDGKFSPSTIYWMNSLQGVSDRQNYFVSINGEDSVNPNAVLKRIQYEHPLFSLGAIRAQPKLPELNERMSNVFFCGSYFKYGFHEDAFTSALNLCRRLTGEGLME
ncbi:MAG TPA: FAD-dependent oxidoreductase [Verrucomicrobiae bacterium]|nr:FAD-dependent oxidoreductase [Verrucomicrobiae bacterium]